MPEENIAGIIAHDGLPEHLQAEKLTAHRIKLFFKSTSAGTVSDVFLSLIIETRAFFRNLEKA